MLMMKLISHVPKIVIAATTTNVSLRLVTYVINVIRYRLMALALLQSCGRGCGRGAGADAANAAG